MKNHYQTVVVGGGIVGAGIFRDLVLNNVETLLIEAGDFASQTSERSSKMLHGGIRYLENMDFPLVFEALHEKNLWLKLAPHLALEVPFYLPVYKDAKRPLWMIQIGLFLYDLLSSFKNTPYRMENKNQCLKKIIGLKSEGLSGAGIYYDGIMDDAKINLEVIYDALCSPKAFAVNYSLVTDLKKTTEGTTLIIKNQLTNKETEITANNVVYALGPYTDLFLKKYSFYNWKNILLPSQGSHIWVPSERLPLAHPIVMTPHDEKGDRVIFVIPHGEKILVGTTEVPSKGDLFNVRPSEDEIEYLINNLNQYFPNLHLKKEQILGSFAGIRPLVKDENAPSDLGKTSREHRVFQPTHDTYVIAGGKYTTFRIMGREITQKICHSLGKPYNPDKTASSLRKKSVVLPFAWKIPTENDLMAICEQEMPRTFSDLIKRRLSISSRKIWEKKTDVDFNEYFFKHKDLLKKYILISDEDILNF